MNSKVFIWKSFLSWRKEIEEMFPIEDCSKLIQTIQNHRMEIKYTDQLDLFKTLYSDFGVYHDLEDAFVTEFPFRFPFVRMYHCCRPVDTNSYYSEGIRILDTNQANKTFRDLFFTNPRFPQISRSQVDEAINSMANHP